MKEFLFLGSALGALFGLLHGVHLYRHMRQRDAGAGRAAYFGLWTFGLWTVLGAYVLAFWILGAVGLAAVRVAAGRETGR